MDGGHLQHRPHLSPHLRGPHAGRPRTLARSMSFVSTQQTQSDSGPRPLTLSASPGAREQKVSKSEGAEGCQSTCRDSHPCTTP